MKNNEKYAQLYLRLALGIGFIYAVLDRFSWLGPAGQQNIAWGNWNNFLDYTHVLLPFLNKSLSDIMGWIATIAELIFGIFLIIGYQIRLIAKGSFILTLIFGLCMAIFLGLKAPFNYSVFAVSAGSLLLSTLSDYQYSLDDLLRKNRG